MLRRTFLALTAAPAFTNVPADSSNQAAAPLNLLVNGVHNPLAIDPGDTRFTWLSPVTGRSQIQSACQILVSSDRTLLKRNRGDVWDSAKVLTSQSAGVSFGGGALAPATRYWWAVRVWEQDGTPGPYSAPAAFDVGLGKKDWQAKFIWDGTDNVNNFAYFRKRFSLSKKVVLAKVFVSAHNDYVLFLNGVRLGMGPARCDPYRYGQYNAYDITEQLLSGENVFCAIGHWLGTWNDSGVNALPCFILEARIHLEDNTSLAVVTDTSWKVLAETPFLEANPVYFGDAGGAKNRAAIRYDARREPLDWMQAGFDDSDWRSADVVDRSRFNLYAQLAARQAEQKELPPEAINPSGSAYVVDFGRCYDGWFRLTMRRNRPGDVVRVEYFQLAPPDGSAGFDEYICSGGIETWKPNIGRHASFRALRISGYSGPLLEDDVRAVWAYTSAEVTGQFSCSYALLNRIWSMSERSARQNVQQAIISVDADREQSPWTADSWQIGNVLLFNHKNTMVIDKIVKDYRAEQMENGDFYACSPAAQYRIPEYSMFWTMLLWEQYLFSGDVTLLQSSYPALEKFLNWMRTFQDHRTSLIDPNGHDPGVKPWRISDYIYAGGSMPSGGFNIVTNCQYYENLRIAAEISRVLGKATESRTYAEQAGTVKKGINRYLFSGDHYYSRMDQRDDFALASTWALRFNLAPEADLDRVIDHIEKSGHAEFGGEGGDAFYSGALNTGKLGDFVVKDLERYRLMLAGNNTNWETFDSKGEYNHAWTAYPGYIFPKYISGIQPTGGAFSSFDIKPNVSSLLWAKSEVWTVKGLIRTRWERSGGRLTLSAEVPANTRARIWLPAALNAEVSEANQTVWRQQAFTPIAGITNAEIKNDWVILFVQSGSYQFKVSLRE